MTNFSLNDPSQTAHAWPVLIASLSGKPLSSKSRWDRAHCLSCGRLVRCSFHVSCGRGLMGRLPSCPDGWMCV